MIKHARPDHPIHALIAQRWSPYNFAERPVSREDLRSLLEAARWAASSYNEQPWSFIVARRDQPEAFEELLGCLVPANQKWAGQASVLMLTAIRRHFTRNGNPNRAAEHDLGLAVGNLSLEAAARGIAVHQMAGVDLERARETYAIPEGVDPWTALALGYAADEGDGQPRARKPLAEFVFSGTFGTAAEL
jgi:nitroreductase